MKKLFISCLVLFLALQLNAQTSADFSATYRCIESKNYYFTYLLQEKPEMKALLATSPILTEMAQTRQANLQKARSAEECIAAFKLTDEEIQKAGEALSGLYQKGNALEQLMTQVIVPSGRYQQYKETGKELAQKIWEQDANDMNKVIDRFASIQQSRRPAAPTKPNTPGGSNAPKNPNIPGSPTAPGAPNGTNLTATADSMQLKMKIREYNQETLPTCKENVVFWNQKNTAFYSISMDAVCALLDVNDCLQAADYEPLEETVNKDSYAKLASTKWDNYPYSAILVLGYGPEEANVPVSAIGKMRAAYAVQLYRDHQAPFIILSGGRVHPDHTPYSEANEMKKYLLETWQVPESAIIMEPQARHTTTNFRNAVRIMLDKGFPKSKYAIVTSSKSHIDSVENTDGLPKRCIRELGYVPYKAGKRLSDRVIEFLPDAQSLIINPNEPNDP